MANLDKQSRWKFANLQHFETTMSFRSSKNSKQHWHWKKAWSWLNSLRMRNCIWSSIDIKLSSCRVALRAKTSRPTSYSHNPSPCARLQYYSWWQHISVRQHPQAQHRFLWKIKRLVKPRQVIPLKLKLTSRQYFGWPRQPSKLYRYLRVACFQQKAGHMLLSATNV